MLMFAKVTGHFVPKSFRTQVIKYLFGHFVLTNYPFRTHVISLSLWSVNSNLVKNVKSGYEMTIVLVFSTQVMSYHFGHFVSLFCLFCTHLYLTDGWKIR